MKISFTGTRNGLTHQQKASLRKLLNTFVVKEFHHGDCVGADDQAANLANELNPRPLIHSHPPDKNGNRAFNSHFDREEPPKDFLARNRDIVHCGDVLIVCPRQTTWQSRGGTWYTHDYALKQILIGSQQISIYVIWPDRKITGHASRKSK